MTIMTIRELFTKLDELKWSDFIYRPPGVLTLESSCLVHDVDDVAPGEELPNEAGRLGCIEAVGIDDLRSIRDNAHLQGRLPTDGELLVALNYYLENDSFISFDSTGGAR